MKKSFKIMLSFGIIITIIFGIFCLNVVQEKIAEKSKQKDIQNQIDYTMHIVEVLKNNGFKEAHSPSYNTIYLDNTETDSLSIYNDTLDLYDLDENSNLQKILDTLLPIWKNNFCDGDSTIIVQKLIDSRKISYDGEIHGNNNFHYKNYIFIEWSIIDKPNEPIKTLHIMHE